MLQRQIACSGPKRQSQEGEEEKKLYLFKVPLYTQACILSHFSHV